MNKEEFSHFKKRLSKVNELRRLFWAELRSTRKEFISKYPSQDFKSDSQWKEIMCSLNDMWESTIKEEMRRELNLPRKDHPHRPRIGGGLYVSDRLCIICGLPLIGRQKLFCSESCCNIKKSRKYRESNKEGNIKAQKKYLDKWYPDK